MSQELTCMGIGYKVILNLDGVVARICDDEVIFPEGYSKVEPAIMKLVETKYPCRIALFGNTVVDCAYLDSGLLCVAIHESDNLPLFAKYKDGWRIIAPWIEGGID